MKTTKVHPWDQRGPNMFVGFDHDGNRVAIEVIDDGFEIAEAARYNWLRANAKEIVFRIGNVVTVYGSIDDKPEQLDAAVDAAMKQSQ